MNDITDAVFVTATDTGVGKTVVSAALCQAWGAAYWKPVQTGANTGDSDTNIVQKLAELPPERVFAPGRVYGDPSAPERAADLEGQRVAVADLIVPQPNMPLVVEGAGGVLVPLNEVEDMTDLMQAFATPAIVVARSTLGTINHTLLTLEALRLRKIPVLGVILNGPPAKHNRQAIERHGQVPVLAELTPVAEVNVQVIQQWAKQIPLLEQL